MIRYLLFLLFGVMILAVCCASCRPEPASYAVSYSALSDEPDKYVGRRVIVRLRIDRFNKTTREATRTMPGAHDPVYRLSVLFDHAEPVPGIYEVDGIFMGREPASTGLPERPWTMRIVDCRLSPVAD